MSRAEDLYERIKKDGESVLDNFILQGQAQELFLDFKRSSDNGKNRHLSQTDRNNLAKAISSFGNSEGARVPLLSKKRQEACGTAFRPCRYATLTRTNLIVR